MPDLIDESTSDSPAILAAIERAQRQAGKSDKANAALPAQEA